MHDMSYVIILNGKLGSFKAYETRKDAEGVISRDFIAVCHFRREEVTVREATAEELKIIRTARQIAWQDGYETVAEIGPNIRPSPDMLPVDHGLEADWLRGFAAASGCPCAGIEMTTLSQSVIL
jgi:hypothetical protein